jgi:hypothetical protein
MYLVVIIICLATVLMLVVTFMTDLLLDPSPVAAIKTYSLSRTQLALWALIIFCSMVYVWGSKNYLSNESVTLNPTTLVLLGISSSVTILGKLIDDADIKSVTRGRTPGRHQDKGRRGFFWDILSNKKGFSVYRVQHVLFTVLLMIFFVVTVWQTKKMPDFDKTLLVLAGISSAGYLGVKLKENRK